MSHLLASARLRRRTLALWMSPLMLAGCGTDDAGKAPAAAQQDAPQTAELAKSAAATSAVLPTAGRYALVSNASGRCVDVAGASRVDGGNIQLANCNRGDAQAFALSETSTGVFKLINVGSGKAVDVSGASLAEGANIQQWADNGTQAQRFRISHQGGALFQITNQGSSLCATVADANGGEGANIMQARCGQGATQQFRLLPLNGLLPLAAPVGLYRLASAYSQLCAAVEAQSLADGAKIAQAACADSAAQTFELRAETGGSYRLLNRLSGKSLDVSDVSKANGALIQQWASGTGANQRFGLQLAAQGFALRAQHSGKCVDLKDWSQQAGGRLQQWDCTGGANQQWLLQEAGSAVTPTDPTSPTPPTTPTNPDPTPTPGSDLATAAKKEIAMELVSSAENSSLDWRAQYRYIQDIGDGRGYTAGIIGFCSGTGDMLEVIQRYTQQVPNNVLARYLPALRKLNGSASHAGLDPTFTGDWRAAATDTAFQQAQDAERDATYFNPAVSQAKKDGLRALGQFIYYDAIVMHGPGNDGVSFGGIRKAAMQKAKTPAQGGNERDYLNAFLDARVAAMKTEEAHSDVSRVETAQRVFLKAGNFDLNTPLDWKVYGDGYHIP